MLRLRLLGGFDARGPGDTVVSLPTRKARALLAYFAAAPGRLHPRDKLTALLWGDRGDQQARDSLRHTLVELRKAFAPGAPALLAAGRSVGVDPAGIDVDVAVFERQVAAGTPDALAGAAELYAGDFLDGFAVREAPFDEWLVAERERLRGLALDGLHRLFAHQAETGPPERAIATATRLLALDPIQEVVHRALMRLHARQGRRAVALRQYQECVAHLQRELRAEPEPETQRLYREILREPAAAAAPATIAPTPMPARLIGRDAELARMREIFADVSSKHGRIALLVGDAGVGKSRLLEALGDEWQEGGGRLLVGRSYETEQILPFAPWVEAVRSVDRVTLAAALEGVDPARRSELARLFPELGAVEGDRSTAPENPLLLFEGLGALLARLAAREPVALVLEDLHWADEMSLRFLAFLARRLPAEPLLVMGSAREENVAATPLLERTLQEVRDRHDVRVQTLGPLARSDTAALVRALARTRTEAGVLAELEEHVWAASEGSPFVVVEVMRGLEEGVITVESSGIPVPPRVRDVIAARLERLSDRARGLLMVAAVIGGEFDFPLLQRAAGVSDRDAAEGLEELVRRRMIQGEGDRFAFTHDRVRRVVEDLLLVPSRQALHAAVGRTLEALHADDIDKVEDRLAYHYARAEAPAPAVRYLIRFAEGAADRYAHGDAAAALEEALVHARRLPAPERDQVCVDLALRRARALSFLGRLAEARDLLLNERARLERLGDAHLSGAYWFLLGNTHSNLGEPEPAVAAATRALEEARRGGDDVTEGRTHFLLALEAFWSGPFRRGLEHAERAVEILERCGGGWWLGFAWWVRAINHTLLGEFDAALRAQAEAGSIAETIGDMRLASNAAWTAGGIHALAGDAAAAIEACERGLWTAPDPLAEAIARAWLGYAQMTAGDCAQAIPSLEQALEQFARFRFRAHGWFMAWLAEAHLDDGRPKDAHDVARKALSLAGEAKQPYGVGIAQRVLARWARAGGAHAVAQAHLDAALATFQSIEAGFEVGRTALEMAQLAHDRADRAAAARHVAEAHAAFQTLGLPGWETRAAELASALGVGHRSDTPPERAVTAGERAVTAGERAVTAAERAGTAAERAGARAPGSPRVQ